MLSMSNVSLKLGEIVTSRQSVHSFIQLCACKRTRSSRCSSCAFFKIDFHRLCLAGSRWSRSGQRSHSSGVQRRRRRSPHRPHDGQRAAAGARAARLGPGRAPAEAALGPSLHAAPPRGARRRCQARRHLPQGARYPQQAHAGEVPEAER